jgi:dUTP pyrophosphatase
MKDDASVLIYLSPEANAAGVKVRIPSELDAGFDLPTVVDISIEPQGFSLIPTGVHLSIPKGWVGLLRDRSSIALKGGVTSAGVIDASYRGEIKVAMHNLGKEPLIFKKGERIAQCVIVPHILGTTAKVVSSIDDLGDTERGTAGFGSTGR